MLWYNILCVLGSSFITDKIIIIIIIRKRMVQCLEQTNDSNLSYLIIGAVPYYFVLEI